MTAARVVYPAPVILSDVAVWFLAAFISGALRNEVATLVVPWAPVLLFALAASVSFVTCGLLTGLYRNRFSVATFDEVVTTAICWFVAAIFAWVVNYWVIDPRSPLSIAGMTALLALLAKVLIRVVWRLLRQRSRRPDYARAKRVVVFGAGEGGTLIIKSMLNDATSRFVPVALLDDDLRKKRRMVAGVRVMGTSDDIEHVAPNADCLLIAVPSASSELVERVSAKAQQAGLEVLILPSTNELIGMMVNMDSARPVKLSDLLGRAEVTIDEESVAGYIQGSVVLVTGAGGSIGSELCRQILRFKPEKLVMVDRDETALQEVQISTVGHGLLDDENLVLADIRDRDRVFEIFEKFRPQVVFHAAALKHLPLLEAHPREGLLTNVYGSENVLLAAKKYGVDRYVNISTDKAASPTSVLGTTKRLAEALTLLIGKQTNGRYLSVRFGNVLGSRGSVVKAFERQIHDGKPITVTHPDVTRFFMTIPEACRLVLQAAAIGSTGETLVLDMGKPMKILDLAKTLLRHHGASNEIIFTGLRPNEKLHEVLQHEGEELRAGPHKRIWHTDAIVAMNSTASIEQLNSVEAPKLAETLLQECAKLRENQSGAQS